VGRPVVVLDDRQRRARQAERLQQLGCASEGTLLGHWLLHPAEHGARALALEPDRNHSLSRLEPDLVALQRAAKHEGGAQNRMPGERQLLRRREDAELGLAAGLGREDEHRFCQVHLARERLLRLDVEPSAVREDGQLIARQRASREDVTENVAIHAHDELRQRGALKP
jgi:hypothetical protein